MKRIFGIIIASVVALTVFVGCGGNGLGGFGDGDLESLEGILTKQSENDDFAGTHLLDTDGEITPLRSLSINLSNSQYTGNLVEVLGVFNKQDDVFEVTGVSVLEVLEAGDKQPEFTSYKNSELGFQLKYYDNWDLEEDGSRITFSAPEGSSGVVIDQQLFQHDPSVFDTEGKDTPLAAFASEELEGEINDFEDSLVKIGIDKLDAIKTESDGSATYYIYRPGLVYEIAGTYDEDGEDIFNSMLSEFQFIGLNDHSEEPEEIDSDFELPEVDMKFTGFESLPFNFEGQYPASWYYAGVRSDEAGVIHHYGFSDEEVTPDNELISLDILSGDLPAGVTALGVEDNEVYLSRTSSSSTVYTELGERVYRFTGNNEYEDLMIVMAMQLVAVDN